MDRSTNNVQMKLNCSFYSYDWEVTVECHVCDLYLCESNIIKLVLSREAPEL